MELKLYLFVKVVVLMVEIKKSRKQRKTRKNEDIWSISIIMQLQIQLKFFLYISWSCWFNGRNKICVESNEKNTHILGPISIIVQLQIEFKFLLFAEVVGLKIEKNVSVESSEIKNKKKILGPFL